MGSQDGASSGAVLEGFTEVRFSNIETELAGRTCDPQGGEHRLLRQCVLNLVIFLEDVSDAALVSRLVDRVADAHPIRVIAIAFDTQADERVVRAWIKVECGEAVSGGRLVSEEIALTAHPNSAARLAAAVSAVLSPDLPVALWWRGGAPFLSRLFKGVVKLADCIVVDSIRFGDGAAALDTLRRLSELRGGTIALADMNWKRTASWRSTLAACFDDPAVAELLPDLDGCTIDFSLGKKDASAPPSARSLLLAGWLVSRWPKIAGRGDIKGKSNRSITPGAILGVALRSSTARAAVSVVWESADSDITATASDRAGATFRKWRFMPDPEGEAELLERCIDSVARDRLLEAALSVD